MSNNTEKPAYRGVKTWHDSKPVYVAEQPAQQEPVAYRCWNNPKNADGTFDSLRIWVSLKPEGYSNEPLYTSPPNVPTARASKPLTDEQIQYAFRTNSVVIDDGNAYMVAGKRAINIARAIEAAHGIKEKNA